MTYYKTKEAVRKALIESLESGIGIRVRCIDGNGSHHYYMTGDLENYVIHCFGSGQGWRDMNDGCKIQDINELVDYLWKARPYIIEPY